MKALAYLDAKPFGDPISVPRDNAARILRGWLGSRRVNGDKVTRKVRPFAGYTRYQCGTVVLYVRLHPYAFTGY